MGQVESDRTAPRCLARAPWGRAASVASLSRTHRGDKARAEELRTEARRLKNLGFQRAEQVRYNERTAGERVNGRLKDEFGGRHVRVRGAAKVMCHCMFGMLALTADQLLRLVT